MDGNEKAAGESEGRRLNLVLPVQKFLFLLFERNSTLTALRKCYS